MSITNASYNQPTETTNVNAKRPTLFGRRVLVTSEKTIDASNVVDVLRSALLTHNENVKEITYLYEYYKGRQPIIHRQKVERPEIMNIIVENNAFDIVSFKVGYVFGDPIQYVRRADVTMDNADGEDDTITKMIGRLNEYMFSEDKSACDREIGETQAICGTAYRGILPDKNANEDDGDTPFMIDCLDPRYTFVVYSTSFGKRPVMGVQVIHRRDNENPLYAVYTDTEYFEIVEGNITDSGTHAMGGIPIIEYPANTSRLGAFEMVLTMLDELNTLNSNRVDGVEQFVQSLMKFINCDITQEDFESLKDLGAIKVQQIDIGMPADVEIMTSELNQSQVQTLVDYTYKRILKICGMPYSDGARGGDTGLAVIMRDGWSDAESRARETEGIFKKSEKQFLRIALKILDDIVGFGLKLSNIDIKFTRNRTDNLLVKTQGLQNMLEAGIEPATAIEAVGLFSDPNQVYLDSKEYLKKWEYKKPIPNQQIDGTKERKVEENGAVDRDKVQ